MKDCEIPDVRLNGHLLFTVNRYSGPHVSLGPSAIPLRWTVSGGIYDKLEEILDAYWKQEGTSDECQIHAFRQSVLCNEQVEYVLRGGRGGGGLYGEQTGAPPTLVVRMTDTHD